MDKGHTPSTFSLGIVQALKTAMTDDSGLKIAALRHRIPIQKPGVLAPLIYTIEITRDPGGTYLATCPKLPQVPTTAATTEEEALVRARANIFNLLHRPRRPRPAT